MRGHFWPFTEVQNGNQREVTRKVGCAAKRPPIRRISRMGETIQTEGNEGRDDFAFRALIALFAQRFAI